MGTMRSNTVVGVVTSTGAIQNVDLGFTPDYVQLINFTNQDSTANPGVVKRAYYTSTMADGSAVVVKNTNSAATDTSDQITTGGIYALDTSVQTFGSSVALDAVTAANPASFDCSTSHNLQTGDIIRCYNTTGMLQIAGMDFQVTVVDADEFTVNLNSSGFAAPATGGSIRKVSSLGLYTPMERYITGISQAASAVIETSVNHGFVAGQMVRFNVPSEFGMTEMNGLLGEVSSVTDANTFVVAIASTAFTAFAFPTSASVPFTFATVVPVGKDGDGFTGALKNTAIKGFQLGSSVCGATSDVIHYIASKADLVQ